MAFCGQCQPAIKIHLDGKRKFHNTSGELFDIILLVALCKIMLIFQAAIAKVHFEAKRGYNVIYHYLTEVSAIILQKMKIFLTYKCHVYHLAL